MSMGRVQFIPVLLVTFILGPKLFGQTVREGVGIEHVVNVGDSRNTVRETLGTLYSNRVEIRRENPLTGVEETIRTKRSRVMWSYESLGLLVLFERNRVKAITIASSAYVTTKGIRVGDSVDAVLKVYGTSLSKTLLMYSEAGIGFDVETDTVRTISIF